MNDKSSPERGGGDVRHNCLTCRCTTNKHGGCEALLIGRLVVSAAEAEHAKAVDDWIQAQDWSGTAPDGGDGCGYVWPVETADGCPGWVRR